MDESTKKALDVLVKIAENEGKPMGERIEAAKIVVNRPRFFFKPEDADSVEK